jgi:hypothetical protein
MGQNLSPNQRWQTPRQLLNGLTKGQASPREGLPLSISNGHDLLRHAMPMVAKVIRECRE